MLYENALRYTQDVLNGKELTTKEVRIQCEWFLRDMQREKDNDYPWYFDREISVKIENLLKLMNFATGIGTIGKSIYEGLADFQSFFLANVFCWMSDGELRETQMTNYFSNLYPIDCAVLSVNAQSYRKYGTLPEHEFLPEI